MLFKVLVVILLISIGAEIYSLKEEVMNLKWEIILRLNKESKKKKGE